MSSTLILLALVAILTLWLFVSALRTGRAEGLVFANRNTRETQPLIFWSYTVTMGVSFIGSMSMLVDLSVNH